MIRLIAQIHRPSNGLALGGKKSLFQIEKPQEPAARTQIGAAIADFS
jgi:ABC-type ATPase involved in cell division